MKNIIMSIILVLGLGLQTLVAGELKPIMKDIGRDFKSLVGAARASDNSDSVKEVIVQLKSGIEKAKSVLPDGVSPDDVEVVARYNGFLNEMSEQAIRLEDAFATNPFSNVEAMQILGEMNALRKKAHAIFR